MVSGLKSPLTLYVLWHQDFKEGITYANSIYSAFTRNVKEPLSRGIGIPVYFRYKPFDTDTPKEIDLDSSEHIAILLLVNASLIMSQSWHEYINSINDLVNKAGGNHIIYPIAIAKSAFNLEEEVSIKNFVRLYDVEEGTKTRFLINYITHELCRLLYDRERIDEIPRDETNQSPPPLKLFISHAKEDGVELAKQIRDYVQSETPLKTFFDANDIAIGYEFPQEIESSIRDSVLLVIHSDRYSSREWCRKEVIIAKQNNRPIVVINVFKEGEERSFPYMANVPNLRVSTPIKQNDILNKILSETLKETLRFKYQEMYIKYLINRFGVNINEGAVLSRPPELLTFLRFDILKDELIVYPDPPLGDEELELLNKFNSRLEFITPVILPSVRG